LSALQEERKSKERTEELQVDAERKNPQSAAGSKNQWQELPANGAGVFEMEVDTRAIELAARAESRKEVQRARRKAVIGVLSQYELF